MANRSFERPFGWEPGAEADQNDSEESTGMSEAGRLVMEFLRHSPDHKTRLATLAREPQIATAIGFGVDAEDIVFSLAADDLVSYDSRSETVRVIPG